MNDILTHSHFENWRRTEFIPHIEDEKAYEKKVDKLDADLSKWLKVVSVGLGLISIIGGAMLTLFFWVLLEKNTQIIETQRLVQLVAQTQQGVLHTLTAHDKEIKGLIQTDREVVQMLIEQYKRQADGVRK